MGQGRYPIVCAGFPGERIIPLARYSEEENEIYFERYSHSREIAFDRFTNQDEGSADEREIISFGHSAEESQGGEDTEEGAGIEGQGGTR
jgi:hypothetical protein